MFCLQLQDNNIFFSLYQFTPTSATLPQLWPTPRPSPLAATAIFASEAHYFLTASTRSFEQ